MAADVLSDDVANDLASTLIEIRERAKSLHVETDRLNASLLSLSKELVALDLGIVADVSLRSSPETVLRFGKHDNRWGLWIVRDLMPGLDVLVLPIESASRSERCLAAERAHLLIQKAFDVVVAETERVGKAIDISDALFAVIRDAKVR